MCSYRSPWRSLVQCALRAAFIALIGGGVSALSAQTPAPQPEAFRPAIAAPLQAAEALIRAGKFADALARIREAEAVADRTPKENIAIDRMRGVAASGAGDIPTAIRSFEAVVVAGQLTPTDLGRMVEVLAQLNFKVKDYPKAATWAARYLKDAGPNADLRWLRIRALYLADDFAGAAGELRAVVEADAKSGAAPQLERVQLLASSYVKLRDDAGYVYALEKLLAYYPNAEYWSEAIGRVQAKPGFAGHLTLDLLRLRQATGTLGGTADYAAFAQLAMSAGLPAEAMRVSDLGFAAGALGVGPDAEHHKKLRDMAARQVAEDEKQLPQSARSAIASKDGTALVNVGFAYVSGKQYDQGIALMEQGMAKGGVGRPEDARLHLGIAYLAAGQKAQAIRTFREVGGTDGTADLAHLWLIHAQRP